RIARMRDAVRPLHAGHHPAGGTPPPRRARPRVRRVLPAGAPLVLEQTEVTDALLLSSPVVILRSLLPALCPSTARGRTAPAPSPARQPPRSACRWCRYARRPAPG